MGIFERMSNGWKLATVSFSVIMKSKTLLLFPILSTISLLLILASFAVGLTWISGISITIESGIKSILELSETTRYTLLFIFYFINYSVMIFFNMGLIHCALKSLNGDTPRVKEGIVFSLSRLRSVLSWALISATVGLILRMVEDKSEKIAAFVAGLLGMLWSVLTFFVVPVMAYENLGVIQAIKRSGSLLKETWGERIGASFAFGIIGFIAFLLILPVVIIVGMVNVIAAIILVIPLVFAVITITAATEIVFIAAAYQYAVGAPIGDFDRNALRSSFIRRKK